jgi:hypothetical protein
MNSDADSVSGKDLGSVRKKSKRRWPLGVSPLHTTCVYKLSRQHLPQTIHTPWKYLKYAILDIGIQAIDSDKNGFIREQKLQAHKLKPMHGQDEDVFPKCQGKSRVWEDRKLHPQYGNIDCVMFKFNKNPVPNVLQRHRATLIEAGCRGIRIPPVTRLEAEEDELEYGYGHIMETGTEERFWMMEADW